MNRNAINERRHAVVIGGSIAGLLAARVLSEHDEQVTLVERDALPVSREARRGVPQGRHTHGLLASGRDVLETRRHAHPTAHRESRRVERKDITAQPSDGCLRLGHHREATHD